MSAVICPLSGHGCCEMFDRPTYEPAIDAPRSHTP